MRLNILSSIFFLAISLPVLAQKTLTTHPTPRLVVVINVEQMRTDYLKRYDNKFLEGGFKRLLREGAVCSNALIPLHVQSCHTGVPTLFTGTYPDNHGIVSSRWYDRLKRQEVEAVSDNYYTSVGGDSREGRCSAVNLKSPALGDIMKLYTNGKAKVYSVGLNDYSSVLSAGHAADGAYWLENLTGNMISSSYYVDQFPYWVRAFNGRNRPDFYLNGNWTPLLSLSRYEESVPDDYALETGYYGKWNTFPYNLGRLKEKAGGYKIIKTTPFGNTIIKDFVIELIQLEHLGSDDIPDLLAINFSSMDYENGSFGPASVEMQDIYLRLDQDIEYLLTFLDEKVGMDNILIVLTSSCPASYPASYLKEEFNMPVGYVAPENIEALLRSYLNVTYGSGEWIEYSGDQQIYLNHAVIEQKGLSVDEVQTRVATFIKDFEGVKIAVAASDLVKGDHGGSHTRTMSRSFNFKRSGDVLYSFEEGWQPEYRYKRTNYTHDSRIPMIWVGSAVKKMKNGNPVDGTDMMPTILELLDFDVPSFCVGRVLYEIIDNMQ